MRILGGRGLEPGPPPLICCSRLVKWTFWWASWRAAALVMALVFPLLPVTVSLCLPLSLGHLQHLSCFGVVNVFALKHFFGIELHSRVGRGCGCSRHPLHHFVPCSCTFDLIMAQRRGGGRWHTYSRTLPFGPISTTALLVRTWITTGPLTSSCRCAVITPSFGIITFGRLKWGLCVSHACPLAPQPLYIYHTELVLVGAWWHSL